MVLIERSRVRAVEAEARSQGLEQRVVVAIREGTGEIAGFTEVGVHPGSAGRR